MAATAVDPEQQELLVNPVSQAGPLAVSVAGRSPTEFEALLHRIVAFLKATPQPVEMNIALNIGVIGDTGTGKSTFINTLRSVLYDPNLADDLQPDVARTSASASAVTTIPTPYRYIGYDNVIVWDLPGIGARNDPPSTYLERINFEQYHVLLILTNGELSEDSKFIINACAVRRPAKAFCVVSTKVDEACRTERLKQRSKFVEDGFVNGRREYLKQRVNSLYDGQPVVDQVYCINGYDLTAYDGPALLRKLGGIVKKRLGPEFWHLLDPDFTPEGIARKHASLKRIIKYYAGTAAVLGVMPVAGAFTDLIVMLQFLLKCMSTFRVSINDIRRLKGELILEDDLTARSFAPVITVQLIRMIMDPIMFGRVLLVAGVGVALDLTTAILLLGAGAAISATVSGVSTAFACRSLLKVIHQAALIRMQDTNPEEGGDGDDSDSDNSTSDGDVEME